MAIILDDGIESYRRLDAAMLFPDDVDRQNQYLQFQKLKDIERESKALKAYRVDRNTPRAAMGGKGPRDSLCQPKYQPPEELTKILDGPDVVELLTKLPPTSLVDEIKKNTTDALLAGAMLMYIHILETTSFKTASGRIAKGSQNIAKFICWKHNLGRERIAQGRPNTYDDQVYPCVDEKLAGKCWGKYRTVSHLWAAYLNLVGHQMDLSQAPLLNDSVDRRKLLLLAQQYERFMTDFFSGKNGQDQQGQFKPVSVHYGSWDNNTPEFPILEKPKDAVSTVRKWVCGYDAKHK